MNEWNWDQELLNKITELEKERQELPELEIPIQYYIPCIRCEMKGQILNENWDHYQNVNYLVGAKLKTCPECLGYGWKSKIENIKTIFKGRPR